MNFNSRRKRQVFQIGLMMACLAFFVFESFAQGFKQEIVSFQNDDVLLSGNLFLPVEIEKIPAVVILHGSGPDEGLEYKIYAEEFGKAGIATLVFDKRGSGKSGGDWRKRPFELMAGDALAAVRYLQNRPEINAGQVGLWGISQGSWTAAFAASRSKDVAFVISVGGNAVSPTQQEIWHKDNMYQNLGYSENARDTARKFWQMVFDWLILVDKGKFPLPNGVLESERSGGSIGLDYNSLPDWAKVTQPVLLIHGELDKLSPANESISRISKVLAENGNANLTYKIFPKSSHTITTNETGLEFDWDKNFAPDYFKFTTDWILANANKKASVPLGDTLQPEPGKDFDEAGKFGIPSFFGRAYPQLILMILFTFTFMIGFVLSVISAKRNMNLISILLSILYLLNFCLICGFFVFLATSIFPQGMSIWKEYSVPLWQKSLPFFGIITLILTLILLSIMTIKRKSVSRFQNTLFVLTLAFIPFLYYWNLIGFGF